MSSFSVTGAQFETAMNQVNEAFAAVQKRLDELEAPTPAKPVVPKAKPATKKKETES